ncbi:MAG: 50S ribosomal protein L29 [Gammaproteobacteria bacterium]|nr:50S ribosomal protein L29 [Gammaproteobacteria bacterium]
MKSSEIRGKDTAALETELLELEREAFNLRMQKGAGQLTRTSEVKAVRRNIARFKTILNERLRETKTS